MVAYELLVFRQRGIAAKLLGDFLVFVKELIEADYLAVVAVTRIPALVVVHATGIVRSIVVSIAHVVAISVVVASTGAVIGIAIPRVISSVAVSASAVTIKITIASVFVIVEAVLLPHEGIGVLIHSLLDVLMLLQKSLQCWMVLHELLILYKRWIATKLLGDFPMAVEKLIEPGQFFTPVVVFARLLSAVIAIFLPHEIVRVFFYLFANAGMILQKGLQFRMPLHVIPIVHERWIVAKLLSNFLVIVQKLIKARQFLTCNVAVLRSLALLR